MANTNKIERAAVRAVEGYLDECPKLEPCISKADKNKIWDGVINIFEKEDQNLSQFFAQVPLQVKGTESIKVINSFRLGRDYIKGYKKVGGTAFFLVQKETGKVFYALLSVEDIELLLQQSTKTIKIDLREVPSSPLDFENEIYKFAANRNIVKVENTSPKEIQELVNGFEGIRDHLKEIGNKDARIELEGLLDNIKNLKDESPEEKDTIGWRDKFYYHSRKAIDLAIKNIKGHDFVEFQFSLGTYLQEQKQYHLAEDYYSKVLKEYRKRVDIVNLATTLNNLGNLHSDLTRYDEAEKEYNVALKLRRELAKTNRDAYIADVAMTLNNLGNLLKNLTCYDEAEKKFNEALKIYLELAKTNRNAYIADVAMTLNNLGNLHSNLTRYSEAEKEYKEALKIYRELAKTNRDAYIEYVAQTLENIALLQAAIDRKVDAKESAEEALGIYMELAEAYPQIWLRYVFKTILLLENLSNNS